MHLFRTTLSLRPFYLAPLNTYPQPTYEKFGTELGKANAGVLFIRFQMFKYNIFEVEDDSHCL